MDRLFAKESDRVQAMESVKAPSMKVSALGPAGSFSELAAHKMCEGYEVVLCPGFARAVAKLLAGEVDYAVLPIENSLNGAVRQNLDLLETENIFGVREYLLPVDQRLATLKGVKSEDIRYIYSHEQAIGQCAQYIREHFPSAQCVYTSSTVESLKKLDAHSAGIVGAHVEREGVVLSPKNIADNKQNFTRFMLVERGNGEGRTRSVMVFLCAVCAHKPGSLLGLLKIFQRHGLNLTRIESRPVKGAFGEYRFFIEFAGNIGSEIVQKTLSEVKAYCSQFKLLGAYN